MDQEKRQSIARAERAASTVLRNHGVHGTPINAVKLAEALGYDVYQATFKDGAISGGVNFQKNGGRIYLNQNDSPTRQRFTLAHEIGHCVLHRDKHENGILERIDMFRDPENHSQEEVEANAFAANLLMPEQLVREMWKRWGSTEILADIFEVSLSAISYRLYNLHLKGDW